jgi:hypothetical protein
MKRPRPRGHNPTAKKTGTANRSLNKKTDIYHKERKDHKES